ncbi:MAG: DUF1016 N-terminal domain-containing protein [Alphaproteobacteria bacterium]
MTNYNSILIAIKSQINKAKQSIENTYRQQVLIANWEIGRIITTQLLPDSKPSSKNRVVIDKLSKDLGRPDSFFYLLAKFYRYYPKFPKNNLSWSHYAYLTHCKDARARLKYEERAIKNNLTSKGLQELIIQSRLKIEKKLDQNLLKPIFKSTKAISCIRGTLYCYQTLIRSHIPCNKDETLVDIGFKIIRKAKKPIWKGPKQRSLQVKVTKENNQYGIKIATKAPQKLYTYKATITRVVDADTIVLNIDLGFDTWIEEKVRLRAIDAPEQSTTPGQIAKKYVQNELKKVKFIIVKTYKEDKFGRLLADIFYLPKEKDAAVVAQEGIFLNQELLDLGYASGYQK